MMMFWNRRRIYHDFSLNDFNKILDALAIGEIKSSRRIEDKMMAYNKRMARVGERGSPLFMYTIYVHKKDAEKAGKLIKTL